MFRPVLSAICSALVIAPETLIRRAEQLALENPDECERRGWVSPGARLEGLVFLAMLWRSDESYAMFKRFAGIVGIVALLGPRTYVDSGSKVAYTEESNPTWKPWVYTGTRLVGLLYVGIALRDVLRRNGT